ncbi:MAG: N-acetylmuramoyl-L-alanine amidase, partial [Salinibacterium sp.]
MKRGDKGPAVVELQNMLMDLGYPMPRWGADGDLGDETLAAAAMFLRGHAAGGKPLVDEDINIVTPMEVELIRAAFLAKETRDEFPKVSLFTDLRESALRIHDHGPRSWDVIDAVCLHQTACVLGNAPKRWNSVGAHLGVMQNGGVNWMHGFDRLVWHGNLWNRRSIGIEVDGLFPGLRGGRVWDNPDTAVHEQATVLTAEQISSTKETIRWIHQYLPSHGAQLKLLVPHRQASKDRRDDPSQQIWEEVALPIIAELGLSDGGVGYKLGDGYAIPEDW